MEKITGQRFEDYVTQNFFVPIGMKAATYFEQPPPQLTTLYHNDGRTPFPYWNILLRPAGAINASARDMAAYLQFYLNRGMVDGVVVMPSAAIDRMETPTRTWEAQAGLKAGYGLSNYTSVHDGFVYHGHDGGVNGGLTDMAYLPEYGVGFFYSINSGNGAAFGKIGDAIRAYITRSLVRQTVPVPGALPADAREYSGWYEPAASRIKMLDFIERLVNINRIRFADGMLLQSNLGQIDQAFIPVTGDQFRDLPKKGAVEPIATAMLIPANADGRFVFIGETMKHIPTAQAIFEILMVVWFVLAILSISFYAPFWIFGGLIKKRRRRAERAVRLWPLLALLSLVAFAMCLILSSNDMITRLGNLTVWSFGLFLSTILFAVSSLASAVALWRARNEAIRGYVRSHALMATAGLLIATAYLAWWGVIGFRTWG